MTSESQLQAACAQLLMVYEKMGRLTYCAIPNGSVLAGNEAQRAIQMRKLKATGLRPGMPDILIILPGGRCAWAELKSDKGRLSAAQEGWRDALVALGHDWRLIRSTDDMTNYLGELGT